MIRFECKDNKDKWNGMITSLQNYGSHYAMKINSRSGILVIFGKSPSGAFACMPDFDAGCHLADLKDKFYNTERLCTVLDSVDGITVATALWTVAYILDC